MKKRKTIPLFSILLTGICTAFASVSDTEKTPNFIFIAIDDLNVYNTSMGDHPTSFLHKVYPDQELRKEVIDRLTPNLEKLSNMGLNFQNAYCASPLCGPSRTALLTGVPPHISGYYHHDKHFRGYETLSTVITLPQYLKRNGYYTTGLGKVFHKGRSYLDRGYFSDWPDQIYSWDKWIEVHAGTGRCQASKVNYTETFSKYWKQEDRSSKHFTRFGTTDLPIKDSNDFYNAEFAARLITQGHSSITDMNGELQEVILPKDKPYFIACGIFAPHLPWIARQEFYDLFPQDEMAINQTLLDWVTEDLEDLSRTGKQKTRNTGFSKLLEYGALLDGETGKINAWKSAFQAYLATVAYCDHAVGKLLEAIENNPQYDNTVVILWSDHGYHNGDKNREGKTTLWEASNHCNLIVFDPRNKGTSTGRSTDNPVSLQDLYPTIVELAGLQRPEHVYGFSLTDILKSPSTNWLHPVLNTFEEGNHALRTKTHRYIRFKNGDEEFYDMINDSLETTNLTNNPEMQPLIKGLRKQLDRRLAMKPENF